MRINPHSVYKKMEVKRSDPSREGRSGKQVSLKEGQVLKGEVVDAGRDKVTIKLQSGQSMEARLAGDSAYSIGDQVTFSVQENTGSQVLIRPLVEGEAQVLEQLKAILGEAGLPKTEANINMVKMLMEQNLPVDQESLKSMIRWMNKYPEASLDKLVFLTKHHLPVTEANLEQLQMLENNEQPLLKALASVMDDLSQSVRGLSGGTGVSDIANTQAPSAQAEALVMSLINDEPETAVFQKQVTMIAEAAGETIDKRAVASIQSEMGVTNNENVKTLLRSLAVVQTDAGLSLENKSLAFGGRMMEKDLQQGAEILAKALGSNLSDAVTSEQKNIISSLPSFREMTPSQVVDLLDAELLTSEQTKELMDYVKGSATYYALAKNLMVNDRSDIEAGKIKAFFNELNEKAELIVEKAQTMPETAEIAKGASDVKASLEFINGLQQDFSFMHLPVFMNDQLLNSELYVMNKKGGSKDDQQTVTALMRLDLLNLGHTDIYVKKTAKNVDVAFYMEDEGQMPVVREQVFRLHNQLKAKGFNVLSATVQPQEKVFDITEDFFEEDSSGKDTKRFSFDMRA